MQLAELQMRQRGVRRHGRHQQRGEDKRVQNESVDHPDDQLTGRNAIMDDQPHGHHQLVQGDDRSTDPHQPRDSESAAQPDRKMGMLVSDDNGCGPLIGRRFDFQSVRAGQAAQSHRRVYHTVNTHRAPTNAA